MWGEVIVFYACPAGMGLCPLATLLVGWVKVLGEVPPMLLSPMPNPLWDGHHFSGFPHISVLSLSWLQAVSDS